MPKWLFLLPLVVFIDPFLLYIAWPHINVWVQALVLIVYPLVATYYIRSKPIQPGDVVTRVVRIAIRVAVWYPGPFLKLASLLLIIPGIERALVRGLMLRFQQHILRGIVPPNSMGGGGGFAPPGGAGAPWSPGNSSPKKAPLPGDEKLKRARGQVID